MDLFRASSGVLGPRPKDRDDGSNTGGQGGGSLGPVALALTAGDAFLSHPSPSMTWLRGADMVSTAG